MAKRHKSAAASDGDIVAVSLPSSKRRIESSSNEKTQTFYANNAFVDVSNWDVKIRFGLVQSANPEAVTVLDVAHIYMSHEHAEAFAEALTKTVNQIEKIKQMVATAAAKSH